MSEFTVQFGVGPEDFRQAEWLAHYLRNEWRYDHGTERWHHYDGIRWAVDKTDQVKYAVASLAAKHAAEATSERERKSLTKLFNVGPLDRALSALATMEGYGTDGSDWDSEPLLLGCNNGIVDLSQNALVPCTPEHTITRNTGSDFVPIDGPGDFDRVAPEFMRVLRQWTSDYDWTPDDDMTHFLLFWFGASMFGFMPEQRFLMMTGGGRNGKGALRHAVCSALGQDYSAQPDANMYSRSTLGPARSNEARADLMAMRGIRIAFFSEPDRGQFNEEMLKAHTGGDIITARGLYQRTPISWTPTHSINFLVNDAPDLEDIGPSMASRIMVADFRHRFEGELEDKNLYDTLKGERQGILSILVWAASVWYARWKAREGGIVLPVRVLEQSRAFIERNDPVAECLRAVFREGPDEKCSGKAAYDAYVEWHKANLDGDPMSLVRFALELGKKGFQKTRSASGMAYRGLSPLGAMALAEREGSGSDA